VLDQLHQKTLDVLLSRQDEDLALPIANSYPILQNLKRQIHLHAIRR
jgi:hypothetical protein